MNAKKIFAYLGYGVAWGCTLFVLSCLIGYLAQGSAFLAPVMEHFAAQVAGSVAVGIGCATTPIVYTIDRIRAPVQVALHAGIALGVLFITAHCLHWKYFGLDSWGFVVAAVLLFAAIWFVFDRINWAEAKKINRRIKELEDEKK